METVGSTGFSAGETGYNHIAFDSNDTPYVVYQDGGNSNKATVMKYDGSSWQTVGAAGFSAGGVSFIYMAIDSNDNPYVVYTDLNESDDAATVMKFE